MDYGAKVIKSLSFLKVAPAPSTQFRLRVVLLHKDEGQETIYRGSALLKRGFFYKVIHGIDFMK